MVLYYRVKIMYFNKIMKSYQFIFLKIPWKFFSNSLVIYNRQEQKLWWEFSIPYTKNNSRLLESYFKSGMEGLEPPKCLDQNQVPYHLATSHWLYIYITSSIWFVNIFKKFLLFLLFLTLIYFFISFGISTYPCRVKKRSRIYQQIVLWCEVLT